MANYNTYFKKNVQSFSNEHNANKFSLLTKCANMTLNLIIREVYSLQ